MDPRFHVNWTNARAAGLAVGAYHFFTFCRDGASQARNFLATVPRAADSLPPAVDLEFAGNCSQPPEWNDLSRELKAYLDLVRASYGQEPVLYMTREFFDAYLRNAPNQLRSSPLWVRDIFRSPHWLAGRSWTMAICQPGKSPGNQRTGRSQCIPGRCRSLGRIPRGLA